MRNRSVTPPAPHAHMRERVNVEAWCIGVVCGVELSAFLTGRVPTVTSMLMRLPLGPRRVIVAAVWVWTVAHFELRRITDG